VRAYAHKILIAAYHMLAEGADCRDLGETYLDSVPRRRTTKSLVRRVERLGYEVQLEPKVALISAVFMAAGGRAARSHG
jgi:transposase